MEQQPKNFSLSSKGSFTINDLVYFNKKQGKILSLLNTTLESKTNALHFTERNIIDKTKKIVFLTNKKKVSGKAKQEELDEKIEEFIEANNILFNHIAKIRAASKLDNQGYIESCPEFIEFRKVTYTIDSTQDVTSYVKNIISRELIEQALLNDSVFFTNFIADLLIQCDEESVIGLIKKVAKNFNYNVDKKLISQLV